MIKRKNEGTKHEDDNMQQKVFGMRMVTHKKEKKLTQNDVNIKLSKLINDLLDEMEERNKVIKIIQIQIDQINEKLQKLTKEEKKNDQ